MKTKFFYITYTIAVIGVLILSSCEKQTKGPIPQKHSCPKTHAQDTSTVTEVLPAST